MPLPVKGVLRVIAKDMGIKKANACAVLYGIAFGLLAAWDEPVSAKLRGLWTSFTMAMAIAAIIGAIRQHRRHKRFDVEWKVVKARADYAIEHNDSEGLQQQVEIMDRLLEENFGDVAKKG